MKLIKDGTEVFFADTYALVEIIRGKASYLDYHQHKLLTTLLNVMELYYHLLNDRGKSTADKYFMHFIKFLVPLSYNCIRAGMFFKQKHKKENLSYVDCVGYARAKELGIKFLTGDKQFENKENVEFMK